MVLHNLVEKFLGEASWDQEYASLASHTRVMLPHGAENGYDPFQAYKDLTLEKTCGYLCSAAIPRTAPGEFVSASGLAMIRFSCHSVDCSMRI
jgi:hypothetical protein